MDALLAQQITDLVGYWREREAQFKAWLGGTATGGPNNDGRYPLSDAEGVESLVDCPAKLAATVGGPAALSEAAKVAALAAATQATNAASQAAADKNTTNSNVLAITDLKNLVLAYRDRVLQAESYVEADRAAVEADRIATQSASSSAAQAALDADADRIAADTARVDAQTARNQAQTALAACQAIQAAINPSAYAPASHTHTIANVTGLQTALDGKSNTGHTHVINDVTGLQTALDGKTNTGHTHTIANVTGLQTALDGKSNTGHTHVINDVTGLQTALNAKLGTTGFTWSALPGKPSTFAPSAHTHVISEVTGLQTALDGKLNTSGTAANSTLLANVAASSYLRSDTYQSITGRKDFSFSLAGSIGNAGGNLSPLEVINTAGGPAFLTFHRSGNFATYLGLDTDSRLKIGGWSNGTTVHNIWHNGNIPTDSWQSSTDGQLRFLFSANSRTFFRSGNGTFEFRDTADAWRVIHDGDGTYLKGASYIHGNDGVQRIVLNGGNGYITSSWQNHAAGTGMYSEATGHYFYPNGNSAGSEWYLRSGSTAGGIARLWFERGDGGGILGSISMQNNGNDIGFLHKAGNWRALFYSNGQGYLFTDAGVSREILTNGGIPIGAWLKSVDALDRLYFESGGASFYKSGNYHEFRHSDDNWYARFTRDGLHIRSWGYDGNANIRFYEGTGSSMTWELGVIYDGTNDFGVWNTSLGQTFRVNRDTGKMDFNTYQGHLFNFQTRDGLLRMGAENTAYCHFYTDRNQFYFNKRIEIDGQSSRYQAGAIPNHEDVNNQSAVIRVRTSAPAAGDGANGDIWLVY
jgi:hypothetical protein